MFFLIGGLGPRTVRLEGEARACPSCGRMACRLQRQDQFLSLFFIPLIRIKKGDLFWRCDECGARSEDPGRRLGAVSACRMCGRRLESDFAFCPRCGARTG